MTQTERPTSTLTGEGYCLKPFSEALVTDRYVTWLNDPEITQFLEVRFERQTRDMALQFVRSFAGPVEKYMWGVFPLDGPDMVGTATLHSINRIHGFGEIGLLIGEKEHWGRGASLDVISVIADYAFGELELRRLTAGTYARHWGMNLMYRKLGFTLEGTLRQAYVLTPGTYVDGYRWAILAEEWRARRTHAD